MGVLGGRSTAYRHRATLLGSYDKEVDGQLKESLEADLALLEDVSSHPGYLKIAVYFGGDDFTRWGRKGLSATGLQESKYHAYTTITIKTFEPRDGGIGNVTAASGYNCLPPGGVHPDVIEIILRRAGPGRQTAVQYLEEVTTFDDSLFSTSQLEERSSTLNYAEQDEQQVRSSFEGAQLVDVLDMQYKSYKEHITAVVRLMVVPTSWALLSALVHVPFIGDW